MHPESYSKTFALLALAVIVGVTGMVLLDDKEFSVTGQVVQENPSFTQGVAWPEFFVGLFMGMVVIGLVCGLWYYEHSRL